MAGLSPPTPPCLPDSDAIMAKAYASKSFNASPGAVWTLIGGFGELPRWLPNIPESNRGRPGPASCHGRRHRRGPVPRRELPIDVAGVGRKRWRELARKVVWRIHANNNLPQGCVKPISRDLRAWAGGVSEGTNGGK